jgi:hypothetical protein
MVMSQRRTREKLNLLNQIGSEASSRGLAFKPYPRGKIAGNVEFEISSADNAVIGVIKETSRKNFIWLGVQEQLVDYARSRDLKLFVVLIDKLWKSSLVIPYPIIAPFARRSHEDTGSPQNTFTIRRDRAPSSYSISKLPLDAYARNLAQIFEISGGFKDVDEDSSEQAAIEKTIEERARSRIEKGGDILDDLKRLQSNASRIPEIVEYAGKRFKRDNVTTAKLKFIRGFKCQIPDCGVTILRRNGTPYVEAAHIIKKSKAGPELPSNILILCPNHHKEFDFGNREIMRHTANRIAFRMNGKDFDIDLSLT